MSPIRLVACCVTLVGSVLGAESVPAAIGQGAVAHMPVREVTVFKDGHAFVLHEGSLPVNADGDVHLDCVPTPVLGTFWPYSADAKVKLLSVSAGKQRVDARGRVQWDVTIPPGENLSLAYQWHYFWRW